MTKYKNKYTIINIKKEPDMIYINTGSVSLPRNELGPSYTIYENKKFIIYSLIDNSVISSIELS